jgi:hypothetical protein
MTEGASETHFYPSTTIFNKIHLVQATPTLNERVRCIKLPAYLNHFKPFLAPTYAFTLSTHGGSTPVDVYSLPESDMSIKRSVRPSTSYMPISCPPSSAGKRP